MKKDDKIFWWQFAGIFIFSIFVFAILGLLPANLVPGEFVASNNSGNNQIDYSKQPLISDPNSLKEVSYVRDRNGNILRSPDNSQNTENIDSSNLSKPSRIMIPSVGIDTVVLQPRSPDVTVLDQALQGGAVYYPGSGFIEQGTMFIFGHNSGLPVVVNKAYKAFTNLEKSQIGDEIYIYSGAKKYTYVVERVYQANAETAFIDLSRSGRRLTISTCKSFGSKSDRWVVDAVLKEV